MSLLGISQILGPLVNTLTSDDQYSHSSRENLLQPIQIQLSKKQKKFSEFFTKFLKFTRNSQNLEKKDESHSLCISEIRDCLGHG